MKGPDRPHEATELEELRLEIERLRREVALAREQPTLKRHGRCPACGGRRFLHAPRVLDRAHGGGREELALLQPSRWTTGVYGALESFACLRCGFVELWVRDVAELEQIPEKDPEFTIHDASVEAPSNGPYR